MRSLGRIDQGDRSQRQRKQIINGGWIVENTPEEEAVPVATNSTEELVGIS
jgi:hypothetical protein